MTIKVSNVDISAVSSLHANTSNDTVSLRYNTAVYNIGRTSITVNSITVNSTGTYSGATEVIHGPANSYITTNINAPVPPGTLETNVLYNKADYTTPYTYANYYTDDPINNSGAFIDSLSSFNAGVTGIAYGNTLFVAVAQDSGWEVEYSSNLYATWSQTTTLGNTSQMNCIDYQPANNAFVAAGVGGAIQTSTDAITWTNRTTANTNQMQGIGVTSGTTVLVGNGGAIQTSTTLAAWTNRTTANTNTMFDVAYSSGLNLWVAVGDGGAIQTSPGTLTTWTNRTSANTTAGALYRVVFAAGQYVAVGDSIQTSTNGTTWTNRTKYSASPLKALVYANGFFVAGSSTGEIEVSTDGNRWQLTPLSFSNGTEIKDMTVGNGIIVIAGMNFNRTQYTNVFTYDITSKFKVTPVPGTASNEKSVWVYQ